MCERIWVDTSMKKIYKQQINVWKNVQRGSLGECRLKL